MVKEWATVVRWQNGRALLRYGSSSGCGSCGARKTCGSYALSKIGPNTEHPLVEGQKIEVGIPEGSLIRSALLVYLTPILGLFIFAGLAQAFDFEQFWIAISGVIGGIIGFYVARRLASNWRDDEAFQPVVLQIGLPPNELSVQINC